MFRPVAVAAAIIIIAIMSYNIANTNQVSWEGAIVVPEATLEDAFDPLVALNME